MQRCIQDGSNSRSPSDLGLGDYRVGIFLGGVPDLGSVVVSIRKKALPVAELAGDHVTLFSFRSMTRASWGMGGVFPRIPVHGDQRSELSSELIRKLS